MYKIIQKSPFWASVSITSFVISIVVWIAWGLNLGIDFTGGTSMQLHFPDSASRPAPADIQQKLGEIDVHDIRVQTAGDTDVVLKMPYIENDTREKIIQQFADKNATEQSFSNIGPTLGEELRKKAITSIAIVLLAIVAYISYAFRKVSRGPVPAWVYGISAIVALLHDIVLTVGAFVVLGHFFDIQIDSLFVTALLTILGFSIHDTIVVYDRIREGLKDWGKKSFPEIINTSINTTLARSLNTTLTTILMLTVLYLFGGQSIQHFVLALLIGITFGTYSSIFIASPMLLLAQKMLRR